MFNIIVSLTLLLFAIIELLYPLYVALNEDYMNKADIITASYVTAKAARGENKLLT